MALVLKLKSLLCLRDLVLIVIFKFNYLQNMIFSEVEISKIAASWRLRKALPFSPKDPFFCEIMENAESV